MARTAHTRQARISLSGSAGRTCSEPPRVVLTPVKMSSPSLLGLFAVRQLLGSQLQAKRFLSTPHPQSPTLEGTGVRGGGDYRSRHALLLVSRD